MREITDGEHVFGNEATAAWNDAQQGTAVLSECAVTIDLGFALDPVSGRVAIDGEVVDVDAPGRSLNPPSADAYRYDVVTVDGAGSVTVTEGAEGTLDANGNVDTPVGAPSRPSGEALLAHVRVTDGGIDEVLDSRLLAEQLVTASITNQDYSETVATATADDWYTVDLSAANWHELSVTGDLWGGELATTLTESDDTVNSIAFGNGYIAYSGADTNVYVHDASDWSLVTTLTESSNTAHDVAFGDGYLAYASFDGNVYVHDQTDWSLANTFNASSSSVNAVEFVDGYIAFGGTFGDAYVHNTSDWSLETTLTESSDVFTIASGGGYIGVGGSDNNTHVYDTSDWSLLATLSQSSDSVNYIAFDNGSIAYCGNDGNVYVHDTSDWSLVATLTESGGAVAAVDFRADSIAYGGVDNNVYVHDQTDWSLRATLTESSNTVQTVAFGPDHLAYGGDDTIVNIHDVGGITLSSTSTGGSSLILYLADGDGTGPHSVTWPSSVTWAGGEPVGEVPGGGDVEVTLTSADGGTTWRARESGRGFQ